MAAREAQGPVGAVHALWASRAIDVAKGAVLGEGHDLHFRGPEVVGGEVRAVAGEVAEELEEVGGHSVGRLQGVGELVDDALDANTQLERPLLDGFPAAEDVVAALRGDDVLPRLKVQAAVLEDGGDGDGDGAREPRAGEVKVAHHQLVHVHQLAPPQAHAHVVNLTVDGHDEPHHQRPRTQQRHAAEQLLIRRHRFARRLEAPPRLAVPLLHAGEAEALLYGRTVAGAGGGVVALAVAALVGPRVGVPLALSEFLVLAVVGALISAASALVLIPRALGQPLVLGKQAVQVQGGEALHVLEPDLSPHQRRLRPHPAALGGRR